MADGECSLDRFGPIPQLGMLNYALHPRDILVVGVEASLVSVRIRVGEIGDGHDGRMMWKRKGGCEDGMLQGVFSLYSTRTRVKFPRYTTAVQLCHFSHDSHVTRGTLQLDIRDYPRSSFRILLSRLEAGYPWDGGIPHYSEPLSGSTLEL